VPTAVASVFEESIRRVEPESGGGYSMDMQKTWTRREALRTAVLIAPLVLVARRGASATLSEPRRDSLGLGPTFVPGTRVGRCTLVAVRPLEVGGIPVVLCAPDGHIFEVDVLRHDPATPGVARAGSLGLYVRNNGTGSKSTHEEEGLGALALADLLAKRGLGTDRLVKSLRTLRERAPRLVLR
jgi:hypothetical protein